MTWSSRVGDRLRTTAKEAAVGTRMSNVRNQGNSAVQRHHAAEPVVVRLAADGSSLAPVGRAAAHEAPGLLHLAVSIQVLDLTSHRWLLQRRAAEKALFANCWANTCCTHPVPGEEPASAARRRVHEEIGLIVEDLVPAGTFTYQATDIKSGLVEHEHDHVFVAVVDTSTATADPTEISELALLPFEEALAVLQSEDGAPWAGEVLTRSKAALLQTYTTSSRPSQH